MLYESNIVYRLHMCYEWNTIYGITIFYKVAMDKTLIL